jgi:hypothetical protein
VFVGLIVIGAVVGGGGDSGDTGDKDKAAAASSDRPKDEAKSDEAPAPEGEESDAAPAKEEQAEKAKVVTFKVWGTAPAGALGPLDITYGSDSDNRKGDFKDGKFQATLALKEDALYYNVMAQLQGSGDINCSVTVNGKTKSGHASGDYNICNAQLSTDLFDGWS